MSIETGIALAALPGGDGGDGGDGAGDAGDGVAVTTTSRDLPKDLLYKLNNFQLNSGDVRHSRFGDRDRYWAGSAHGRGCQ